MESKRVLFISQEIHPYLPENTISSTTLALAKKTNDSGHQVRVFMPRFGVINERRHQLHEVIRLSGMNVVINDMDMPLIIKVASVPGARMQVYFITMKNTSNANSLMRMLTESSLRIMTNARFSFRKALLILLRN